MAKVQLQKLTSRPKVRFGPKWYQTIGNIYGIRNNYVAKKKILFPSSGTENGDFFHTKIQMELGLSKNTSRVGDVRGKEYFF